MKNYFLLMCLLLVSACNELTPPDVQTLNSSIERGAYLSDLGNCFSCHTQHADKPFAGGVAFKTEFGTMFSTNITPDKTYGLGQWSFADFYTAMKNGTRPNGEHLYPAFPYTDFARISDDDLGSLWLYLSSLEAINKANQANDLAFPFNQRPLMGIWKRLFHDNHATRGNMNVADDAYSRGEYLVEGLGHCGACHTPRNGLGAEDESLAFTGTKLYGHVKTGQTRAWSSSNLTRHHEGLDNWTTEDIAAYLKRGYNQHSVVHGPMNEVIVNSTSRATEDDIFAMATYIHSLPANAQQSQQHEKSTKGEVLYTIHCGSCHLDNGQGDDILGVSLVNNAIVQSHDPATFINVILYGPHLPGAPFITDRSRMKMLGKRLSDKEIADIATFVRVNFNNNASPVSADEVAQQR